MNKALVFLVLLTTLSSFFPFNLKKTKEDSLARDEVVRLEIISHTSKMLKKRHNIFPMGFGASALDKVESLSIMFQVRQHLTIEEGRG